ncbi:hypothetical protein Tco_0446446 [Tanacetum coccineum]
MPTEMELTLEQTQQGVSYEVSNIRVISFTMKMEILLDPTSNKLMVDPHGFEGIFKDGDGGFAFLVVDLVNWDLVGTNELTNPDYLPERQCNLLWSVLGSLKLGLVGFGRGYGVAGIKRRHRDLSSDGVRDLATASGRGRLKEDLESSTYTQIDINHAAGGNLKGLSAEEAWETIKDCAQCDKQWKNPTSTISDQTITNLKDHLVGNEVVRVKIPKCMSWLDAYDEPIGDLDMMEDKVDNPSPQSTPQVLPSFEVYTPPMTYPKEVKETLGTPIEVEPLEETQLEDLGLNTCNYDIPLSSRGFLFMMNGAQPQPLPNCPSLDASLGNFMDFYLHSNYQISLYYFQAFS